MNPDLIRTRRTRLLIALAVTFVVGIGVGWLLFGGSEPRQVAVNAPVQNTQAVRLVRSHDFTQHNLYAPVIFNALRAGDVFTYTHRYLPGWTCARFEGPPDLLFKWLGGDNAGHRFQIMRGSGDLRVTLYPAPRPTLESCERSPNQTF